MKVRRVVLSGMIMMLVATSSCSSVQEMTTDTAPETDDCPIDNECEEDDVAPTTRSETSAPRLTTTTTSTTIATTTTRPFTTTTTMPPAGTVAVELCDSRTNLAVVGLLLAEEGRDVVRVIQERIGAYPDGIWGVRSQAALEEYVVAECPTDPLTITATMPRVGTMAVELCDSRTNLAVVGLLLAEEGRDVVRVIQERIGAYPDGIWGVRSQAALEEYVVAECPTDPPTITTTSTTMTTTTRRERIVIPPMALVRNIVNTSRSLDEDFEPDISAETMADQVDNLPPDMTTWGERIMKALHRETERQCAVNQLVFAYNIQQDNLNDMLDTPYLDLELDGDCDGFSWYQ